MESLLERELTSPRARARMMTGSKVALEFIVAARERKSCNIADHFDNHAFTTESENLVPYG